MINNNAQSTMEYLIILTVVTAAVVWFVITALGPKYTDALDHTADEMKQTVENNIIFSKF